MASFNQAMKDLFTLIGLGTNISRLEAFIKA
jgi:hypothetical protein